MTTLAPQTVASVHWLNWLDTATVIKFGDVIVAGQLTRVWYDTNTGVYDFVIGGKEYRATGADQIIVATPADAAPALYGVPLGS